MRTRRNREISIFTVSFLDVFANTIGGLSFLLILAIMMTGSVIFTPPLITSEKLPDGYDGTEYAVWLGAREGLGKFHWAFGDGKRPEGLELDAVTGKLSGLLKLSPSDGDGQFEFTVLCESKSEDTQGKGNVADRRFSLKVRRELPVNAVPLRILTDAALPAAYRQQQYPLVFAAEGGQAPYSWSGSMPAGLTLSNSGQVAGTPSETGKFNFDVTVSTPQGQRQTRSFSLLVSDNYPPPPPVPPLKALTRRVPAAVAGREYGVQLAAEGGSPPYSWSAVSGQPNWLRVGGDGVTLGGQPDARDVGESQVVWQVSDAGGASARTEAIALKVLPPVGEQLLPLRIKTKALPEARVGQPYALAVAGEGGLPPYTWACADAAAAPGLNFANEDATLGGTPERAGRFPYSVSVTDGSGQRATAELALDVRPAPLPVKILTRGVSAGRIGQPYNLAFSAVGGYAPYRWRLVAGQMPPGLMLDEQAGTVAGTPEKAGDWEAQLNVADAEGTAASEPLVFKLEILTEQGARRLLITTRSLPTLLVGAASDVTLACEGGAAPYTWRADGSLPDGLRLEEGRISGTPSQAGTQTLALSVSDATGQTATANFPLNVKRTAPYWLALLLAALALVALCAAVFLARAYGRWKRTPLRVTTESLPNARASCGYTVQLACEGGLPPYRWRVVEGELPPGLSLSHEGKLSGLPFEGVGVDVTKDVPFTVEVRDGRGATTRQRL